MEFCEETDARAVGHAVVDCLEDTVEIGTGFYETEGSAYTIDIKSESEIRNGVLEV